MLFEHLDLLGAGDLLLMDRSYPCRWLVALLNKHRISFCMRVEKAGNAGLTYVRDFPRSGLKSKLLPLPRPTITIPRTTKVTPKRRPSWYATPTPPGKCAS